MPDITSSCARNDFIETLSGAQLTAWQTGRLREVTNHAYFDVPFYRKLWDRAGVEPELLRSLEDFERFPTISKQDLVDAGDGWTNPHQGPVAFSTRGTSGAPLLVWLSAEEEEAYIEPTMRGFRWAGFRSGMTALLMSPVWHRLAACEAHAIARLGGRCAFFWGSMGSEFTESFLHTLSSQRPEFITTTAPFLLSLIRGSHGATSRPNQLFKGVRSVVVVGLPLTPRMREFLRDRLEVEDVFERGGTQEGAAIDECRCHTAPHVHEDVCYLEVLDDAGIPVVPGSRGRLIVTKLSTAGSVFVRYDTGDIAAFAPGHCPCGCGFRRLKIYGRPESSVLVGDRTITAYDVRMCIEEDPALVGRNVLLIREANARAGVLSVAVEGAAHDPAKLQARLREQLGVASANLVWLGDLRVNWGFRQVLDGRELQLPRS
ncbi:MAG: AMP-binding protein [Candidatus Binatus sp.]|jgi:phenylacetate-CoA ligase|uniref:phenylacetate--CoA ligase family protein n=1 Tax=Candidatus Binatus sp. TaxID=2811406 RepID=UPI003C8218A4